MSFALFVDVVQRRPYSSQLHCVKTLQIGPFWSQFRCVKLLNISGVLRIDCDKPGSCQKKLYFANQLLCSMAVQTLDITPRSQSVPRGCEFGFYGSPALDLFNCMHVQVPKYFGEFEFILMHFLNKLCFVQSQRQQACSPCVKLLSNGNKPEKERKAKKKKVAVTWFFVRKNTPGFTCFVTVCCIM